MLLLANSDDTAIHERLTARLAEVQERFTAELISDLPCVNALVTHVERYRGKMLRPMLVLVSGMASASKQGELGDAHLVVATVTEMVHMATLVHDDILDEAQIRRGGSTINHLKGNEAAVMLGDYLISHAYHLCSSLGSTEVSGIIADTTNTVCEGELLQLTNRGDIALDERTYFEVIRRKTGVLCGSCCRLGAVLSGASVEAVDGLCEYGQKLGIAFQIVDDLLDLLGTEDTVGKTLGKDLQKGKLTLPLIHFLKSADAGQRREMLDLLDLPGRQQGRSLPPGAPRGGAEALDGERLGRIRGLVASYDSTGYASQWATRLIEQAKASLSVLEPSPARLLLLAMADAVLTREF